MEWRKEEAKKMNEVDSCHSKRIRAFRNVAASDCLELASDYKTMEFKYSTGCQMTSSFSVCIPFNQCTK